MKTITNLIFLATTIITVSSCGGSKEEATEEKEMTFCECYALKDKYDSKEDAEKGIGKEKVDKCMDLMKDASEDELAKCK